LRLKCSGIAENAFVSMRRGGASRYIIAWFHLSKTKGILKELVHAVDVLGRARRGCVKTWLVNTSGFRYTQSAERQGVKCRRIDPPECLP
jgi:hypothetical protein